MTRGRLIARVAYKFGLTIDVAGEELTQLQELANEAVIDVLLRTHCHAEIGDMGLLPGIAEYRLDVVMLAILGGRTVTAPGLGVYEVISMQEILSLQVLNPISGGTNKLIAIEDDLLVVSPTPTTGESIRFVYVPKPAPMTSDAEDPATLSLGGIATQYQNCIEDYMNWKAADLDQRRQSPVSTKDYHDIYIASCVDARKRVKRRAGRGLTAAKVGYPGRRLATRNDVYPSWER